MGRTINITEDGLIAEEMRVIMEQMGVHEDNMHQVNYTKLVVNDVTNRKRQTKRVSLRVFIEILRKGRVSI